MSAKIEPGTYDCKTTAATIYEAPSGAVMCRIGLDIGLTGGICLVQKDGTLSERGFRDVQAIFGWSDWDWGRWGGEPEDHAGHDVQAVIETAQGERGEFSSVKYINPPGGGSQALPKADAKSLAAKYGAKTRALLGGTAPAAPKPPAAGKRPPPPATKPPAKPSTMEDCWAEFCKANEGTPETELYDAWHAKVLNVTGKTQNDCTPADWGKVYATFDLLAL
jgi:hypothetical protein